MAGASPLRTVMLWRESVALDPGASADIVVRRGLVDPIARPGSNGYLPADILADAPQNMTNVAASGGNTMAHRAVVRGSFVALAYTLSPDRLGADVKKTMPPTAHYNLHFTRSTDDGRAGTWSPAIDLSQLTSPAWTVVEPRLVATPGTIVNPLTGTPEAGDRQNQDVLYLAFAVQRNAPGGEDGRIYATRSVDFGASFERLVAVSGAEGGQSESQIQPTPDGATATILWMAERTPGDPGTKEAMGALLEAVALPDLGMVAGDVAVTVGAPRTVSLQVRNRGEGEARQVIVRGTMPPGVTPVGIGDPGYCRIGTSDFECVIPRLASGQGHTISITLGVADAGRYEIAAEVTSADLDADPADNGTTSRILAGTAPIAPAPDPAPLPTAADAAEGGGGCTLSGSGTGVDPGLPLLLAFGALGLALQRMRRA